MDREAVFFGATFAIGTCTERVRIDESAWRGEHEVRMRRDGVAILKRALLDVGLNEEVTTWDEEACPLACTARRRERRTLSSPRLQG